MQLPYPGGPEISRLAEEARAEHLPRAYHLPRPMIHSDDFDFSFSGIKTAVLYLLKDAGALDETQKKQLACEFEDAVTETLIAKTKKALADTGAGTLVIGGGVSANKHLREAFASLITDAFPDCKLSIPARELTTDNALMIAIAGYFRAAEHKMPEAIRAEGNLSL
jgi:N6-L-threonylcarbamoyladenine synthase